MALTIFNKIFARQRIIAITILGTYLLLSWKELNVLFLCLCVLFLLMSDIADINSIIRGIDQATLAPPPTHIHSDTETQWPQQCVTVVACVGHNVRCTRR